jgi:hypothetical protein
MIIISSLLTFKSDIFPNKALTNWYVGMKLSNPVSGIEFCTRGSCASNVIILLTPISTSSESAKAQSKDSLFVFLCCLLSYKKGMMTLTLFAFAILALMILFKS